MKHNKKNAKKVSGNLNMHSLFWTHPTAGSWFIMREILKRRILIRHCQWNRLLAEILIFFISRAKFVSLEKQQQKTSYLRVSEVAT